jgi:hypothetical protein
VAEASPRKFHQVKKVGAACDKFTARFGQVGSADVARQQLNAFTPKFPRLV